MTKILLLLGLMSTVLLVCSRADSKADSKGRHQSATVVSVDKHEAQSNYVGSNPTDAPLQADDYSYDIGVRLDCNVYIGRYESAIDYLPAAFAPNHNVDVLLQKHIMFISLPGSGREVKMGIVGHERVKDGGCAASS
jgi:hypothetical protein